MSGKSVQVMSQKQHTTPTPPITKPEYRHPLTHRKENLIAVDQSCRCVNSKQLILFKDDVNSY